MSMRTALRNGLAIAALQTCKATGVQVSFENMNADAVTLWAMPSSGTTAPLTELGTEGDETERVISIPRQTNFPPDDTDDSRFGIVTDAQLTIPAGGSGKVYSIRGIQADSLGVSFQLTCTRLVAKRTGGG